MTKEEEIQHLKTENTILHQKLKLLEEKVAYLLELIDKQSVQKDSHNSHNPPGTDKSKPKNNTVKKTGRSSGGQKGHSGKTLEMVNIPDEIHDLQSDFCSCCGADLRSLEHKLVSRRQEVVLPPISPVYVEYRQWGTICTCGHHQKASFPPQVQAPIQFGPSMIALVSYLNVFQYVPYARLKLLMKDIFHLEMSEGSIQNLLNKAATKARPVYESILGQIKNAPYVGSDETGAKINGEKWWIWVWQNLKNTFIKTSKSRGFDTIASTFEEGLPNATVGSDRWAAQLKITSKNKQLCFPHLLRDLNFLIETEKNDWATQFKTLLKDVLKVRNKAIEQGICLTKNSHQTYPVEQRLNALLADPIHKEQFPKTFTFQKAMIKHQNALFTCLYDLEVPPDNNASERAIRNIRVKQKISGQFKSGQNAFCTIRSVIDTLRKRQLDVFFFLNRIMTL